jgi:ribosome biogenesis GTPase YqeH
VTNVKESMVCTGCGATLQSESVDAPGYLPASAGVRENAVCRRCYRIRHYGEFSRVVVPSEEYATQVSQIAKRPGTVLYVLDVFDIHGSIIPNLSKYIGPSPVIAVVNKVDLLPQAVHADNMERWVRRSLEQVDIHPRRVLFVSGQENQGMDKLWSVVEEQQRNPVYVVGMANVGKSTILNKLVGRVQDGEPFTASRVPGTTLGLVKTNVTSHAGREVTFVDTPGLIHGNRVTDVLCADCLSTVIPTSRLKPRVFQLDPGQSLWLGGFARFDFEAGSHQPVACYVSNSLAVHRTKLENADHIGANHADDILKTPCPACRQALGDLKSRPVAAGRAKSEFSDGKKAYLCGANGSDIVLAGVGWISLMGKDLRGTLWTPRDIRITLRPRLVGDVSRHPR